MFILRISNMIWHSHASRTPPFRLQMFTAAPAVDASRATAPLRLPYGAHSMVPQCRWPDEAAKAAKPVRRNRARTEGLREERVRFIARASVALISYSCTVCPKIQAERYLNTRFPHTLFTSSSP